MKIQSNFHIKKIYNHIVIWSLIIIYYSIDRFNNTWSATIIGLALYIINYMFVFYSLSMFAYPKFWVKQKINSLITIIIVLQIYWIVGYISSKIIIPYFGGITYYQNNTLFYYLNISFYYFIITASAATASFFSRYSLNKLKLQAEKEKLLITKEINFLKTQFNSRLTFDFLNYCNRSIQPHSPETAESVSVFTDMLKYTLQTQPNEKVALNEEIAYIKSFVNIQSLLSSNVYVNFDCIGNTNDERIIPRILITFVENAFKHGLYNNREFPIDIRLAVEDNSLSFIIKNKINNNKKVASSHTGLENVKQALELHYAGKYNLKIEEDEVFYDVKLIINK